MFLSISVLSCGLGAHLYSVFQYAFPGCILEEEIQPGFLVYGRGLKANKMSLIMDYNVSLCPLNFCFRQYINGY